MSNRLMQILASLAQRRALRTLNTICETQHQISTRKLGQYLEPIGDELAGHAFHLRIEYDALTSKVAELESELAKLRAGQEPVGEVQLKTGGGISLLHVDLSQPLPPGTKLYTTPQPSTVPDVSVMARVLSDRSADACNIDRADNWTMYGQEYIDDVQAMLEVARLNGKEVGRG